MPHTCWLVQQAHSATEELVYRFLRSLTTVFETHEGQRVVQASYNEIRRGCNFQWRTTARRITDTLRAKHSIRLAATKHEGGKRRSGEGNNTATYWLIPRFKEVLSLRRADPKIAKDRFGRVWVIGRGKHFLTPEQVEAWKLNDDYQRAPVPAYIPQGGEEEYTAWAAEAGEETPPDKFVPPPAFAAPPPEESPPGDLKPGKVKRPPDVLMEFAEIGTKLRPGWTYVWKFYEEMKAEAAKHGFELPLEVLAKAMRVQLKKLSDGRAKQFSYFYTVRELLTPDILEQEGCPRLQRRAG